MKKKKNIISKNTKMVKNTNEKKGYIKDKITSFLEIPKEMLDGCVKMSVIDNNYILLEGDMKIEDYLDSYIKIKTKKYIVILEGKKLDIREMNKDELVIEGNINNISYI